jgi:hypothetical protein
VVQNVKLEESNHVYLELLSIGSIQTNLCASVKLQTNYIPTLHIFFGLCWHQSPKRGEIEREMAPTLQSILVFDVHHKPHGLTSLPSECFYQVHKVHN